MTEDEERHYIVSTLDRLEHTLGVRPDGWLSPNSASPPAPPLLAEAGLRYVADWANDEQPYPMSARAVICGPSRVVGVERRGRAVLRLVSPLDHANGLKEAFDVLCADGKASGRALGVHLHPWLSGQAFRAGPLEDALDHIRSSGLAWLATPGEIVEWCRRPR